MWALLVVIPMHPSNPLHPTLPSVHTRARRLIEGWQLSLHYTLLHAWCMYRDVIGMFDGTFSFCVTHILGFNPWPLEGVGEKFLPQTLKLPPPPHPKFCPVAIQNNGIEQTLACQ